MGRRCSSAQRDPMGKGPLSTTDTLTLSPPASAAAPRAILRKGSLLQSSGGRQRRVAPVARAAPSAMAWRSAKVRSAAREVAAALPTAAAARAPCPASRSVASGTSRLLSDFISSFFSAWPTRGGSTSAEQVGGQTGVCVSGGRGSRRDLPVVAELGERGLADAPKRCSHVLDAF